MKNFREEQITFNVINQYWEKDIVVDDIIITFYYWKRKKGCVGYDGNEQIREVVGVKNNKKRRIKSVWSLNLGEEFCIGQIVAKFNNVSKTH
jgi:hypothetical protein